MNKSVMFLNRSGTEFFACIRNYQSAMTMLKEGFIPIINGIRYPANSADAKFELNQLFGETIVVKY